MASDTHVHLVIAILDAQLAEHPYAARWEILQRSRRWWRNAYYSFRLRRAAGARSSDVHPADYETVIQAIDMRLREMVH